MVETYFVKDGLLNGEPGVYAKTCGFDVQQPDGWYYLPEDATDGEGPYASKDDAILAYEEMEHDMRHLDARLSLDDFDSLPGDSPLRDQKEIPTYREAYELHGTDWK